MSIQLGYLFRRYSLVTLLPLFVASTIYLDYSHTKEWKKKKSATNTQ